MVDKNVFCVRSPRRWEVAVFRCPVDLSKPYVKRVAGLPGEKILLAGGDLFADGVLQRKTLAQLREVALPVFDLNYAPPAGWGERWLVEAVADDPRLPNDPLAAKPRPAGADIVDVGILRLDAIRQPSLGLTYRQWNLDEKNEDPIRDFTGYNGPTRLARPEPVHDFYFACEIEVLAGAGSFALRLGDGADTVRAELPIGPGSRALQVSRDGGERPATSPLRLDVGRSYALEFAFADRRVHLAIDGTEVVPAFDLPADPELLRGRASVRRPLQLGIRGASIVLRNVKLLRDVHYRSENGHATKLPHALAADEYFVLGDNSANSYDSRGWEIPGVPERDFIGKPFLIHQPLKVGQWTVNGQTQTFQTVDWDRVKWLR